MKDGSGGDFRALEKNDDQTGLDDREIVRKILDGSVNSYEILLVRHKDMVLRIVRRHIPAGDVEEVAQDVFVRGYESLPTFKGRGLFSRWLSSIAVRTCYDYWRKIYRGREIAMSGLTDEHREWMERVIAGESEQALHDADGRKKAGELLDWALDRMSPKDRMVLELIYLEGLSMKEVADLLGWSSLNVKVRAFRSRKKMEKILTGAMAGKGYEP